MITVHKILGSPQIITWICIACICSYYLVSWLFINKIGSTNRWMAKSGIIDRVTSFAWTGTAVLLIASLYYLCSEMSMPLRFLLIYYFLFIFLFAIVYGIIDWHYEGIAFDNIDTGTWKAELQYFLISLQTQTTLGYTNSKPKSIGADIVTSVQALMGVFFIAIFISLSLNNISRS